MEGVSVITKYFKNLDDLQLQRFTQLGALYATWNERVNLVSRPMRRPALEQLLEPTGCAGTHVTPKEIP